MPLHTPAYSLVRSWHWDLVAENLEPAATHHGLVSPLLLFLDQAVASLPSGLPPHVQSSSLIILMGMCPVPWRTWLSCLLPAHQRHLPLADTHVASPYGYPHTGHGQLY